ncbi:unnamed protein product, partial [Meganyctiphanes norvegica]
NWRYGRAVLVAIAIGAGLMLLTISMPGQQEVSTVQRGMASPERLLKNLRQRVNELSIGLDRLWCITRRIGSTGGFCLTEDNIFAGGNHAWDVEVCRDLENLFGNSSVVDMGAGLGHYGKCFLRMKDPIFTVKPNEKTVKLHHSYLSMMQDLFKKPKVIKSWDGYDGAINVGFLSNGFIKQQDLSITDMWLGRTWDWVLSLEVGEHIPAPYEDIFIDNLVRHGCKGLVLSWAVKNQGGHHHVNEHSNAYVKQKMAERGLTNDADAENIIRTHTTLNWFKNTIMVFRYPDDYKCENGR